MDGSSANAAAIKRSDEAIDAERPTNEEDEEDKKEEEEDEREAEEGGEAEDK